MQTNTFYKEITISYLYVAHAADDDPTTDIIKLDTPYNYIHWIGFICVLFQWPVGISCILLLCNIIG